jgi:hypothetical protein
MSAFGLFILGTQKSLYPASVSPKRGKIHVAAMMADRTAIPASELRIKFTAGSNTNTSAQSQLVNIMQPATGLCVMACAATKGSAVSVLTLKDLFLKDEKRHKETNPHQEYDCRTKPLERGGGLKSLLECGKGSGRHLL